MLAEVRIGDDVDGLQDRAGRTVILGQCVKLGHRRAAGLHAAELQLFRRRLPRKLGRKHDELRCYDVEVCLECSWNYMIRTYFVGRRIAG